MAEKTNKSKKVTALDEEMFNKFAAPSPEVEAPETRKEQMIVEVKARKRDGQEQLNGWVSIKLMNALRLQAVNEKLKLGAKRNVTEIVKDACLQYLKDQGVDIEDLGD